jgi:hypothetical protein
MKKHEAIFEKIKVLFKKYFTQRVQESSNGLFIAIEDTGLFIASNESYLTIGFWLTQSHYESDYYSLNQAVDRLFNLLTKRKRVTEYLKGDFPFKHKIEIELSESNYEDLGIAMTRLFPYWKRTRKNIIFLEKLIDKSEIEKEIEIIKNYAQQRV